MSASWEEALRSCLELATPCRRRERVTRAGALGRILVQTVCADRDYPAGDFSMMDGYAIDGSPGKARQVQGENRPGTGPGEQLASGKARRIFTGAQLPENATRVVPQEMTKCEGDVLIIEEFPETAFVRRRGSEACGGETVLAPGLRVTAVELSILASLGVDELEVAALPRVAHLVTGDEIMARGEGGGPGTRIRDSNSDLVAAALGGIGQDVREHRHVQDDRKAACRVVFEMTEGCDLLLISGGASVGDHDFARPALEAAGFRFEAHGLDVRPGKPVGLARRGAQWAIALPGNPVSHLVALHLFVLPLLLALEGVPPPKTRWLRGMLDGKLASPVPRRDTFWPSRAELSDSQWHLTPCRFLSSGDLLGIAGANSLLFLKTGAAIPEAGREVFFLSLAPLFTKAFQR